MKPLKYFINGLKVLFISLPKYIIIGFKYITEKKDPNKPNQNILGNKFIPMITITLSLITYLLSVFIITRWYVQNERNKKFLNSLNEDILAVQHEGITEKTPDQYKDLTTNVINESANSNITTINTNYINVNLNYYIQKNKETVAWVQLNNTNVNYPVVEHNDNDYYLYHDFYNRKTDIGWIFADYRDNFETFNNNTIIYGHNLINRTMFGQVPFLLRKSWFNNPNSHYIKLSTKNTNSIWQIFSVYKIKPTTDYLQVRFNSTDTYQDFLNMLKKRSEHQFDIPVSYTDKIITLSTCDDTGTKRVAVHAKLIKIDSK